MAECATLQIMKHQTAFAQYRKTSGKTLAECERIFDVDKTTILRWEKGTTLIPVKRLAEIERVTGIARHALRPDLVAMFAKPMGERA